MKYDVFISYSRKDTAIADQICAAFDNAGISYFIDRQGIVGSGEFPEILADAILESQFFLFLASQNSYSSKYTKKEIHFAFNEKPSGTLFPYLIDDSTLPKGIKLVFSDINIRSIKEHPIETVLVDDVLHLLGRTRPATKDTPQLKQEEDAVPHVETTNQTDAKACIQPTKEKNVNQSINKNDKNEESKNENKIAQQPKQEEVINSTINTENESELNPQQKGKKWGFADRKGNVIIPFEYDYAFNFSEGLAPVDKNGSCGFINKHGQVVIHFDYDNAFNFSEGLAPVDKNGKRGFIDKQGNIVIPFEYDVTILYPNTKVFHEGLACVRKDGKWGYIDRQGQVVIPFDYDENFNFSEGLACVKKDGKWGYIDRQGQVVIHFDFDENFNFSEGLACVKKEGKWGFIDEKGNIIIPIIYELANHFIKNRAWVQKKNLLGITHSYFIDKQGNKTE